LTTALTAFPALILGVIQGATEFLPVSSSAHLAITHWLTGWSGTDDLTFDVALHFGTLVAILIYFGKDWAALLTRRGPMLWYILVACVPGALAGAKFEELAETTFRSPVHIAVLLAFMGLVMAAAERLSKRTREMEGMRWADAVWIGVSQALAIMPGVSRSGVTMTTGLFLGLTREAAARFSFLLSTPILAGAALFKCRHLISGGTPTDMVPYIIGIVAAAVSGLACIHFLMGFLKRHTFYPFAIYRVALAAVIVAIWFARGGV
jgi:undecaprenyl-diphosphatase